MTQRQLDLALILGVTIIILMFGFMAGKIMTVQNHSLIQCQEDEVWYPVGNFTGSEAPEDLKCINREEL